MTAEGARRLLLQLYTAALKAVDGRVATRTALQRAGLATSVSVFAIGKAAAAMTHGAYDHLQSRLQSALVITRPGYTGDVHTIPRAQWLEAAHPVPDASTLAAGEALMREVKTLAPETLPLFLISGGASSLVEVLRPGVGLEDLRRCNQQGLSSGIAIEALNAQRAALSMIKGGGLAALLAGRQAMALFISDVPGDDPDVIGSGLMGRAPRGDAVRRHVIGSGDVARRAAVAAAVNLGLRAEECAPRFDSDAEVVARCCVAAAHVSAAELLVWCGESTVRLPGNPGRGGRNQQLALAAALSMEKRSMQASQDSDYFLLAAGTDGSDGNSDDAGAIVDAGSCARMREARIDPQRALRSADAGSALAASQDLINTGPTGTNVGDLVMTLRARITPGVV